MGRGFVWVGLWGVLMLGSCLPVWCQALRFPEAEARIGADGYGVLLERDGAGAGGLTTATPVAIKLFHADGTRRWLRAGYDEVTPTGENAWLARARVTSPSGSVLEVSDRLSVAHADEAARLTMRRRVEVVRATDADLAFVSSFGLRFVEPTTFKQLRCFVPGVLYGHPDALPPYALMRDPDDMVRLVREDRLPMPMCLVHRPADGVTARVVRPTATGRTIDWEARRGRALLVDAGIEVASLGPVGLIDPALSVVYPAMEGERTYCGGAAPAVQWAERAHPLDPGVAHAYEAEFVLDRWPGFESAMLGAWAWELSRFDSEAGLEAAGVTGAAAPLIDDQLNLLMHYWTDDTGVPGLPFSVLLPGGEVYEYVYVSGFVGQQTGLASHMIEEGRRRGDRAMIRRGRAMIAFWVEASLCDDGFALTWADPGPLRWRTGTPISLRTATEGMEGVLRAWRVAGGSDRAWLAACRRFGDWVLSVQRHDGSFDRAFDARTHQPIAEVAADAGDTGDAGDAQDTTPLGTSHPIRFLVDLALASGESRYLDAARRAGDYALTHTVEPGRYVAGVPDNPNVTDSHAAALTMQAFLALYDATGQPDYLDAARTAGRHALTWTYVWDVAAYPSPSARERPDETTSIGASIIATGHSSVDQWMALYGFDYYRLYLMTGDEAFRTMARLVIHGSRQTIERDGAYGDRMAGLQTEVMQVRGASVQLWLPWLSYTTLDPLIRLREAFGTPDLDACLAQPIETQREKNRAYGKHRGFTNALPPKNTGDLSR